MIIDAQAFAREGRVLEADLPLAAFARLRDSLSLAPEEWQDLLHFRLSGRMGDGKEAKLELRIRANLPLVCQRCLEPFVFALGADNLFRLVASEDDITDDEIEDDLFDYLVAEREMDVTALIEDEIILSLPLVAVHEHCSLPPIGSPDGDTGPFAGLASLKSGNKPAN